MGFSDVVGDFVFSDVVGDFGLSDDASTTPLFSASLCNSMHLIAAPIATASSASTPAIGIFPPNCSDNNSLTRGIRDEPPTRMRSVISSVEYSATSRTSSIGPRHFWKRSSLMNSNIVRAILSSRVRSS